MLKEKSDFEMDEKRTYVQKNFKSTTDLHSSIEPSRYYFQVKTLGRVSKSVDGAFRIFGNPKRLYGVKI